MKFYVNKFFTYTIRKTSLLFNPIMHEQESGWLKNFLLLKKENIKKRFKKSNRYSINFKTRFQVTSPYKYYNGDIKHALRNL